MISWILILSLSLLSMINAVTYLSDTKDISTYALDHLPDSLLIEKARSSSQFISSNETYQFGMHLTSAPVITDSSTTYTAAALISSKAGSLFYRNYVIEIANGQLLVRSRTDIPLNVMKFKAWVGLIDRLVVVEDVQHGVHLGFSLGVGGIDPKIIDPKHYLNLTPMFRNAYIDRQRVIKNRTEPAYFRGRPFMQIIEADGSYNYVGFHISILSNADAKSKGLNYLVRGFESHGCLRMREKDLMEFFTIVIHGALERVPVNVYNHIGVLDAKGNRDPLTGIDDVQAAYPLYTESYMRVKYFPDAPHYKRDTAEHLVILENAPGQPDFSQLFAAVE